MKGINDYWQQLNKAEIESGKHREFVGGIWEDMGSLQQAFLKQEGLLPGHKLVDVG